MYLTLNQAITAIDDSDSAVNDNINTNSLITFSLPATLNSISIFAFNSTINSDDNDDDDAAAVVRLTTGLVSGYEKTRPVNFVVEIINRPLINKVDGYVISCVRLPYISTKLITSPQFSASPTIVIVQTANHFEVWHVFGIRKHAEQKNLKAVTGVYINESGVDVVYRKEYVLLRGNVPAAFVSAFATQTNVNDVDTAILLCGRSGIEKNDNEIYFNF
nr:hp [Calliteara abietis nucleopolyhedrovirus]